MNSREREIARELCKQIQESLDGMDTAGDRAANFMIKECASGVRKTEGSKFAKLLKTIRSWLISILVSQSIIAMVSYNEVAANGNGRDLISIIIVLAIQTIAIIFLIVLVHTEAIKSKTISEEQGERQSLCDTVARDSLKRSAFYKNAILIRILKLEKYYNEGGNLEDE